MFEYFYHGTIKKTFVAFASLFNNIYISRKDENGVENRRFKVPCAYGPQAKFIRRLDRQSPTFDTNLRIESYLPMISFEMTNVQYDSARKLNSIQSTVAGYSRDELYRRYERVPYNLSFSVGIISKTMEDSLQIVEQILPYFGPEYTLTIKAVDHTDQDVDIPVVFSSASFSDGDDGSYGDGSTRKITSANLQFVAKTYIYGPVNRQGIILEADANIFDTKWINTTGPTYANINVVPYPGVTAGSYFVSLTGPGPTGTTHDGALTTITEYPYG